MSVIEFPWRSRLAKSKSPFRRPRNRTALVEPLEERCLLAIAAGLVSGLNVSATQDAPFSGAVALFVGTNPLKPTVDYSATIDWGDKSKSSGTITASGVDQYTISGQHTYSQTGTLPITITISDLQGTFSPAVGNGTAVVSPQPILVFPQKLTIPQGQSFKSPPVVAYFVDTDLHFSMGDFSAYITWSDGLVSKGTISGTGGVYKVTTDRTGPFSTPGTFPFNVVVTNTQNQASASASGTLVVTSNALSTSGTTFAVTPGVPFSNVVVATLTDTNPAVNASNVRALIDWGNGQTTLGTVTSPAPGSFVVTGSFTYTSAPASGNSFPVTVTIFGPAGLSTTAKSTALVVNTITGITFSGGLAPASAFNVALGLANTNRPFFTGNATPFAVLELYARRLSNDATLPLGQTVAGQTGTWTLLTGPLAAGTYVVTATVVPPGGSPSNMLPLANGGRVVIGALPFHRSRVAGHAHAHAGIPGRHHRR